MSDQQNLRIVQDGYRAFQRGDIPAFLGLLSEDVEWDIPGAKDVPYAGLRHGRDQVAQFLKILGETDEIQHFEPQQFFADGELVVVLGHYRARVKATGRIAENDWVHVFRVRNGQLSNFREFYDTAALAEAYRTTTATIGAF